MLQFKGTYRVYEMIDLMKSMRSNDGYNAKSKSEFQAARPGVPLTGPLVGGAKRWLKKLRVRFSNPVLESNRKKAFPERTTDLEEILAREARLKSQLDLAQRTVREVQVQLRKLAPAIRAAREFRSALKNLKGDSK